MKHSNQAYENDVVDKPMLLKAVEIILADPMDIKKQVDDMENQYNQKYGDKKSKEEIQGLMCDHIIKNYSYYTAFSGGITALTGVVPGLGTLVATFGGATADAALCMKFEIEMVMAIAHIYGRDITNEEEKLVCFIVAGLGTISEFGKQQAKSVGSKMFVNMIKQYLKGSTLVAVKQVFKKVGFLFTQKAVVKAAPFGIGVMIGASFNKMLTQYVGSKAKDFYNPYAVFDDKDENGGCAKDYEDIIDMDEMANNDEDITSSEPIFYSNDIVDNDDLIEQFKKLKAIKDMGCITEAEYEQKRQELLSRF